MGFRKKIHNETGSMPQRKQAGAVETNMASGYYLQYAVNFTVDSAGVKTIVACPQNPSLVGTIMP